jgi:hypothetical protein
MTVMLTGAGSDNDVDTTKAATGLRASPVPLALADS